MGIAGAFVGGLIWGLVSGDGVVETFSVGTLLIAVAGAIVLLFIWGLVANRRTI